MARASLTHEKILTAVRQRQFEPLYFLYGEETFLMDEIQQAVIESALEPHERDFNLDIVYGSESETGQVLSLCAGYPMMAERRVVIVREFERLEDNRPFTEYASKPSPTTVVVLVCASRPNLSTHPYRALKENAATLELKPLREADMPRWIEHRLRTMGRTIEPEALQMLVEYLGTDLRTVAGELDKLITLAGDRTAIVADDVLRATGQSREFSVFELQKTIGSGRYRDAVRIGERLLQQASNPRGEALMIVAVLTTFFSKLWRLIPCMAQRMSDGTIAAKLGIRPFFVREYQTALRLLGPAAVEDAFGALLAADFELKGGAERDPRTILLLLLARLIPSRT